MDILMTYWSAVWRDTVGRTQRPPKPHSTAEYDHYLRRLERRAPAGTPPATDARAGTASRWSQ
jgi:hypothetical protein